MFSVGKTIWYKFSGSAGLFILCLTIIWIQCKPGGGQKLFEYKDSRETGVDFINAINPFDSSYNIIQYLYAYNGAGVAVGDINNDGLPDIYFGSNRGENRLYLNEGDFRFKDITAAAGVAGTGDWSTGVSMVDINADGYLDIYVCQLGGYKNFSGRNLLYINNRDLTFTESAEQFGLDHSGLSTQAAYLDYDLDGDLDIYLLCHSIHDPGNYSDTTLRKSVDPVGGDRLFRNDGTRFVDVTSSSGIYSSRIGYGLGVGISDFNRDGYPDIFVGNDFHENDYFYINRGDGTFENLNDISFTSNSKFSMGMDISDINNDGYPDLFSVDMKPNSEYVLKKSESPEPRDIFELKLKYGYHHQYARNVLQLYKGQDPLHKWPLYAEIAQLSGVDATDWSWSALFSDFDSDGFMDIYITNGILFRPNDMDYLNFISNEIVQSNEPDSVLIKNMPDGKNHNFIFRNKGDLSFEDVSGTWLKKRDSYSNGAAYGDLDNDGDVDLVVNNLNGPAYILQNKSSEKLNHHFIKIRLQGTDLNPYAVGAVVRVFAGDHIFFRELYPVRGFMSSVDYTLHIGLGQIYQIDSLIVDWPDGRTSIYQDIIVDALNILSAGSSQSRTWIQEASPGTIMKRNKDIQIDFRHRENAFNDTESEQLLPYLMSREGPALAIADVNGDGLDDLFIGGASGQSGGIYLQDSSGNFYQNQEDFWKSFQNFEDVDAVFFDLENDGDPDLFVASGGNHLSPNSAYYTDRVYVNNGNGQFSPQRSFFEAQPVNSSCVAAGDINGDGFTDIFVGARSVPGTYGMQPISKIWLNDGSGRLQQSMGKDPVIGMVTDAQIRDLDNDGSNEIIIAGHWMPLIIYWNEPSGFVKTEINGSKGLWNTIEVADIDGDSYPDIVAGNMGLNSHLKASQDSPLKMYTNDFNQDGSFESVITYIRDGKEYPIFHKDQLLKQMISLKQDFIKYEKFAKSSIKEFFRPELLVQSQVLVIDELRSAVFYGQNRQFRKVPLPVEAQLSPVRAIVILDINNDQKPDILALGNSDDFIPMIGRMTSNYGFLGLNNGQREFLSVDNRKSGLFLNAVCTSVEIIRTPGNTTKIIFGINDNSPVFFDVNL